MSHPRLTDRPRPPRPASAAVPLALAALLGGCAALPPPSVPSAVSRWSDATTAAKGAPESIGSPAAGCLRGAASLTPDGPGFRSMRIARRRFYGHPRLLDTLRDVASSMRDRKAGTLLLGDLSMPRGGPMTGAHESHQTGLDADVWFSVAEEYGEGRPFTLDDRENLPARKFGEGSVDAPRTEMIRLFASHPSVDRLFVAPGIKQALCRSFPGAGDAPWLRKVRPWWGHEDHLHLRVTCPPGSPACDGGKEIPPGNGCDASLEWWFGPEARAKGEPAAVREEPILPEACRSVAEAPSWE